MTPQSLLKVLKATAEQKGYFLHADEERLSTRSFSFSRCTVS